MLPSDGTDGDDTEAWSWVLEPPSFGLATASGAPKRPDAREVAREVWRCVDVRRDASRWVPLLEVLFTLLTLAALVGFACRFSGRGLVVLVVAISLFGTVTNTIWLHRYCSHRAFTFRRPWMARVLGWLNGLAIAEDRYAVPHFVHHLRTDRVGDPYGPHLGRLGSWFATFLFSKRLNRQITPEQYERLVKLVRHIGHPIAPYDTFRRYGSTEHPVRLVARLGFAQVLFSGLAWAFAGESGVLAWFGAVALSSLVLRDFNYTGHGGARQRAKRPGWEVDDATSALNQRFYGWLGSEWHNTHHRWPRSANTHLAPGQVDRAFLILRLWHALGIVSAYRDDMPRARELLRVGRPDA
jgi:stearoyl-CoA desaturase (delta-9 desaturase)